MYFSGLLGSLLYFLFVKVLPKFLYYSQKFGEHSYDRFFEFFIRQIISLYFFRIFFLGIFLVPSLGRCFSVFLFCLTFYVRLHELDKIALSPSLDKAVVCRRGSVQPVC